MLKHVPFYSQLVGKTLTGVKLKNKQLYATASHVLVYGAVEAHSKGPKGCVAGNDTIGAETGLTEGTVAKTICQLSAAGWVVVSLTARNYRTAIKPADLTTLALLDSKAKPVDNDEPALPHSKAPGLLDSNAQLYSGVNIEDNSKNTDKNTLEEERNTYVSRRDAPLNDNGASFFDLCRTGFGLKQPDAIEGEVISANDSLRRERAAV